MITTPRLPELPPMRIRRHSTNCAIFDPTPDRCDCESPPKVYDAGDLHAYGLAVWKAAIQHAARACESEKPQNDRSDWTCFAQTNAAALDRAIDAIRSLPLPEQGSPQ